MTLLFFPKYTICLNIQTLIIFLFQAKSICVPKDYVKFELPPESPTVVYIGIDIKDIPKVRLLSIFVQIHLRLHFNSIPKEILLQGVPEKVYNKSFWLWTLSLPCASYHTTLN